MSNTRPRKGRGAFSVRSVTQHPQPRTIKPSARELFRELRPRLLGSRPFTMEPHRYQKDGRGKPVKVHVYGAPTFRNVIDETGAHV